MPARHRDTGGQGAHALRLPARLESLPLFRDQALAWAAQAGLAREAVDRLDLVLEEALVNVVSYAYGPPDSSGPSGGGGAAGGDIELALEQPEGGGGEPGRLILRLTDWGEPFDPLAPADAGLAAGLAANLDADLDHRALGGLGLVLVRTLAEASYARLGPANVLRLSFGPRGT